MESVVKYVVYRLPAIAVILFYWITIADWSNIGQSSGPVQTGELLDTAGV